MSKTILFLSLLFSSIFLMGCTLTDTTKPTSAPTGGVEQKQGDTIITGKISGTAGAYFIQESGKNPQSIDSYSVDLGQYVGQVATITGQYSGDTLFVGEVK